MSAGILIGDVGATGSDWIFFEGGRKKQFSLTGYNPVSQANERLSSLLQTLKTHVGNQSIDLYYYGAGVGIGQREDTLEDEFRKLLVINSIQFASDLLGAARALCTNTPGVVCILGTGSNACRYDGVKMLSGHSLGFPLGDEGSGMDIGRRLVRSFYYGLLPKDLFDHFSGYFPKDRLEFLKLFKSKAAPNQFLAGYTELVLPVKNQSFIQNLLEEAFTDFIKFHLHDVERTSKINAVGSIAYYFCGEFEKCLNKHDLKLGQILRKPIDALAAYHLLPNNEL
ncbi:MAG: hypothetical protein IPL46_18950 [Saprospiraceae bacterium]|nr:hypothetical protein [Saprospiraceae bacterium]